MTMAVRGLSLKDMGLMGLITREIWSVCKALVYGKNQNQCSPPEHDVSFFVHNFF